MCKVINFWLSSVKLATPSVLNFQYVTKIQTCSLHRATWLDECWTQSCSILNQFLTNPSKINADFGHFQPTQFIIETPNEHSAVFVFLRYHFRLSLRYCSCTCWRPRNMPLAAPDVVEGNWVRDSSLCAFCCWLCCCCCCFFFYDYYCDLSESSIFLCLFEVPAHPETKNKLTRLPAITF